MGREAGGRHTGGPPANSCIHLEPSRSPHTRLRWHTAPDTCQFNASPGSLRGGRSSFSLRGGFGRVPSPRPHGRSLESWRPLIRPSLRPVCRGGYTRVAACEGTFLRIAACEGANLRPPDFPSLVYVVRPVPLQNRPVVAPLHLGGCGMLKILDSLGCNVGFIDSRTC